MFYQLSVYHMKILLFQITMKECFSSNNWERKHVIRLVNVPDLKDLIVKNTKLSYHHIHKYTRTSSDGISHNQIYHVLEDMSRQASIIDIFSLR